MTQPSTQVPDPFAMWRDWLSNSERQWNGFLNEVMATDQFGESMGRMMDVYLNMQKNMNDVMGRYFSAINVPTRTDLLALGNRLSDIEERLGGIEGMVKALGTAVAPAAVAVSPKTEAAAIPRPPRTRKPAKA